MPRPTASPLTEFFTELPPKDRELVILSLDLQLSLLRSKSDDEKQDLLEARILNQVEQGASQ